MGKQKLKKTNAYATFADQNKKDFKEWRKGMSFSELLQVAKPYWEGLDDHDREYWRGEARSLNGQVPSDQGPKMETSCHRLDMEGPVISEHISKLPVSTLSEHDLDNMLASSNKTEDLTFIIVDSILFVDYDNGDVLPAEFGFVRASLTKGVMEEIHFIVDPRGMIRPGYVSKAMEGMELNHNIPIDGPELDDIVVSSTYELIGDELKRVINKAELFLCRKEQLGKVNSAVHWLWDKTGLGQFKIYPIEEFIRKLLDERYSVGQITERLDRGDYDYESSIRCPFHAKLDTKNCARKNAHKYFYLTAELLNDSYQFDVIEGKHKPVKPPALYKMQKRQNPAPFYNGPSLQSCEPENAAMMPDNDLPQIPRTPMSLSKRGGGACGGTYGRGSEELEEVPVIPRTPRSHSHRGGKKSSPPMREVRGAEDPFTTAEIPRPPIPISSVTLVNLANDSPAPESHDMNPPMPALIPRKPKSTSDKSKECKVIPNLEKYSYDVRSYTMPQAGPPPGMGPPPPGMGPPPGFGPTPRYPVPPGFDIQTSVSTRGRRERGVESREGAPRGRRRRTSSDECNQNNH